MSVRFLIYNRVFHFLKYLWQLREQFTLRFWRVGVQKILPPLSCLRCLRQYIPSLPVSLSNIFGTRHSSNLGRMLVKKSSRESSFRWSRISLDIALHAKAKFLSWNTRDEWIVCFCLAAIKTKAPRLCLVFV